MAILNALAALGSWINAHALVPYLPVWAYAIIAAADTHVTTACVTLYLHRAQTHRSIAFNGVVEHFMRFWLWVRTAMPTREWVAVHRCHHAHVDTPDDPHSPIVFGIWRVVLFGTALYHTAAHDQAVVEQYGKGTPDDALERHIYTPLSLLGPVVTLGSNVWIFGCWGIAMWLVEMAWIPFFAAGVINGLGHWWGYRNFETPDHSRNLPGRYWSLLTCGEALHNNHHHVQNSPRFAMRPGELDPGYWYFRALKAIKLARVRHEGQAIAAALVLLLVLASASALAQAPASRDSQDQTPAAQPSDDELKYRDSIDVVGVTPIHGIGLPIAKVPSNVQVTTAAEIARTPGAQITDALLDSFGSVHGNEAQSNPFQPDIQFRGFAVSPLLGLPQGLAVYQDGIRVNEPFGDTVNWDLLPTTAVAAMNLMPGSNPLFGLNALGGALSIETKSGFIHRGSSVRLLGGSFGRVWADLESGGHSEHWSYYASGRVLNEDGWRDFSPSRLRQLFAKGEWRNTRSQVSASFTGGSNNLTGNGPAPIELLDQDRSAVFTHPDITKAKVGLMSINARHVANDRLTIEGTTFFRPASISTFNGDATEYEACGRRALAGYLCANEDDRLPLIDQFGRPIAIGSEPLDATNHTSFTRTRGWGGALQATVTAPLSGHENHFFAGVSLDVGDSRYEADTEIASLTADRGTVGTGLLDSSAAVRVKSDGHHLGFHIADFYSATPRLTVSGSGRYTVSAVNLHDQLGADLTGDHDYSRFNPSGGATFDLGRGRSVFGSYSEASRVPTPSELSCANPDDPCRLPNAFTSDPPLDQVVARTVEAGMRGRSRDVSWSAAAFRTENSNDILFISGGSLTNEGHFENVGDTLRRGIELMANGAAGSHVRWNISYTHLLATFDTPLVVSSPNHPDAVDGEVPVPRGAQLPNVPRNQVKGQIAVSDRRASFETELGYLSSQFYRGDEANLLEPMDGSFVAGIAGRYAISRNVSLSAHVANIFGAEFSTFGLLGDPSQVLGDAYQDRRFESPGAPRSAWAGIEITFP